MKTGVFTSIVYDMGGVALKSAELKMLLIGPPVFALSNKQLTSFELVDTETEYEEIITREDTLMSTLKADSSDKLYDGAAIVFKAKLAGQLEADLVDLVEDTDYVIDVDAYNNEEVADDTPVVKFNVEAIRATLGVEVADTPMVIIYFDITAIRSSMFNKRYTITNLDRAITLLGSEGLNLQESITQYCTMLAAMAGSYTQFDVYYPDLTDVGETYGYADPATFMNVPSNHEDTILPIVARFDNYYLAPIVKMEENGKTDYEEIISLYKTHCVNLSTTDNKKERRVYFAKAIVNEGEALTSVTDYFYKNIALDPDADVAVAVNYPIVLNTDRVTLIGDYYAWLDDGTLIEGGEIAAIVAAYRSSLPLGYGMTTATIPLLYQLPHFGYYNALGNSNDYETLKNAGWMMAYQETEYDPPQCYHQHTTIDASIAQKEESLPIIIDKLAKDIRLNLKRQVAMGVVNKIVSTDPGSPANARYIKEVNQVLQPLFANYKRKEWLAGATVKAITPNETYRGVVDIVTEVRHYYPVNRLNVVIYVL